MTHPERAKLAKAFESESAAFLKLIGEKELHPEALEVVRLMRENMLKLLTARAQH
jgi:hypothetical protein